MNTTNTNITFQGKKLTVLGKPLTVGMTIPSFKAVGADMGDLTEAALKGKKAVILTVPSLDTPVCSIETKRFSKEIAALGSSVVALVISMDLPFAQKRWCGAEGVTNVVTASDYKYRAVGEAFGTHIQEMGLLARAVFVCDATGKITHVEYVPAISDEPQYDAALAALR